MFSMFFDVVLPDMLSNYSNVFLEFKKTSLTLFTRLFINKIAYDYCCCDIILIISM